MSEPTKNRNKLTEEQRKEIIKRVLAGEKAAALGAEFGVTRACVSLLKQQHLHPERFTAIQESKRSKMLSKPQLEEMRRIITTSTPEDNDLIPARERWSLEHGFQLAEKLFNKRPSMRAMKDLLEPVISSYRDILDEKPKPPKKHHINQLDPELAKDEDFVAYYLSPICEQIAWREYEMALKQWEERQAAREKAQKEAEEADFAPMQQPFHYERPGVRTGKHAKSKGPRHTPPKRRKKRRK